MKIEVVLTEAEIVQELTEAVEARDLPEKFFYWSPLAVRAWLARAADPAFVGLRRAWQQLAAKAAWLLEPFGPPIHAISFGAGDGSTDRLLLDAIRQSGREPKYYPVDASQALLEMACAGAEDLDIETAGIKADISSPMHLVFASDAAESPKLLLMSGNTLGGFDPLDHVKHMAQCLHGDERLILDAEIYQTNGSLPPGPRPAYRHPGPRGAGPARRAHQPELQLQVHRGSSPRAAGGARRPSHTGRDPQPGWAVFTGGLFAVVGGASSQRAVSRLVSTPAGSSRHTANRCGSLHPNRA